MRELRIIGLAVVVVCAALAAYILWPSGKEPSLPPAVPSTAQPFERDASALRLPVTQEPLVDQDEETVLPVQEEQAEDPVTAVAGLTLPFFDDLARRIVDGYHPARTEHNAGNKGVLLISLSSLNRVYGVQMFGLEHAGESIPDARQKFFDSLLRPEMIDAAWQAFHAYLLQELIEQSLAAKRIAPLPDGSRAERSLNVEEVAEFLRLLSASTTRMARFLEIYVTSGSAAERTETWLNARDAALAANSHYQHVDAALEEAVGDSLANRERIADLKLERDGAAQEILRSIKVREELKTRLLEVFRNSPEVAAMPEPDQLYASQWLFRRLSLHPDRAPAFLSLAEGLDRFAENLGSAAGTITLPATD